MSLVEKLSAAEWQARALAAETELVTLRAQVSRQAEVGDAGAIASLIYEKIKHGDGKHQAWLFDACKEIAPIILSYLARQQPMGVEK